MARSKLRSKSPEFKYDTEVQHQMDAEQVVRKLLRQPVMLMLGEVLRTSFNLGKQFRTTNRSHRFPAQRMNFDSIKYDDIEREERGDSSRYRTWSIWLSGVKQRPPRSLNMQKIITPGRAHPPFQSRSGEALKGHDLKSWEAPRLLSPITKTLPWSESQSEKSRPPGLALKLVRHEDG